jgi:hypothetical protein
MEFYLLFSLKFPQKKTYLTGKLGFAWIATAEIATKSANLKKLLIFAEINVSSKVAPVFIPKIHGFALPSNYRKYLKSKHSNLEQWLNFRCFFEQLS